MIFLKRNQALLYRQTIVAKQTRLMRKNLRVNKRTPEQYKIAGLDFVLDTYKIKTQLGWSPTKNDQAMLFDSLNNLISAK